MCAMLAGLGVFIVSCTKDPNVERTIKSFEDDNTFFTVSEARAFFENGIMGSATRSGGRSNKKQGLLNAGEFTPLWNDAQLSYDDQMGSIDVPIISENKFRAIRSEFKNGKANAYTVDITQKYIVIKNKKTSDKAQYLMTLIPDKGCEGDLSEKYRHLGKKSEFSGIVIYTSPILNLPVRVDKYKKGEKVDGVFLLAPRNKLPERLKKMRELTGSIKIQIGINGVQTRSGDEEDYSWWEETLDDVCDWAEDMYDELPIDAADMLYHYVTGDGEDYILSDDTWNEIRENANGINYDTAIEVEIGGETYYKQSESFYDTSFDLENSIGTGTVYYDSSGEAVGFYDEYDFNPMDPGERSDNAEDSTTVGGYIPGDSYDVIYGVTDK